MRIVRFILLSWLLLIALTAESILLSTSIHAQSTPEKSVDDLWIDVGLRPQLVEDFNNQARPNDVARVDHPSMVDILQDVTIGRKLVVFKSVADARALLPHIADQFDIIGYNLEHGPANRPDEQADPIGSVIRMRELADEYGKEVAFGPDRAFAEEMSVDAAPYVDIIILQVQRVQTQPETVRGFVEPLATQYRRANPEVEVSIQIRTEGDVKQLHGLIASMTDTLDGVSILTSDETVSVGMDLIDEFRPAVPSTPITEPAFTPTSQLPTRQRPTSQPTLIAPDSTPTTSAPLEPAPPADSGWFFLASLLTVGILGGGLLVASIIYVVQHLSGR